MHTDATDVVTSDLDLTGVESNAHIAAELPCTFTDRAGALNGSGWAVECSEEPVTRRLDLPAFEPFELAAHHGVVRVQVILPRSIANCRRLLRRVHQVAEHDRGQHAGGITRRRHAGEELFGLIEESMCLFPEQHQIGVR